MFHRPKTEEQQTPQTEDKKNEDTEKETVNNETEESQSKQDDAPQKTYTQTLAKWAGESKQDDKEQPETNTRTTDKTIEESTKEKVMSNETQDNVTRQIDIPASGSYQARPSQPGTFSGGAYPGASNGSGEGRRLVISEGITMSGEITACDYLVIEGTVEASLQGSRVLEVTDTGTFYGSVEIDEATIAGRFEGEIVCNGRLTIKSTGVVTGSISYRELQVEAGAEIDGKLGPLKSASGSSAQKGGSAGATGKKSVNPKNDNQGNELPLASGAVAAE